VFYPDLLQVKMTVCHEGNSIELIGSLNRQYLRENMKETFKKKGKKVKFYTAAALVNALLEANDKGSLGKFLKQIEKLDLLVIDELGYIPLHKQGAELLFQIISMCYEAESIIVTTNLQFGQWNNVFGDPILTEAVIDRLIHHSHLIIFKGDSHRYKDSISLNQ